MTTRQGLVNIYLRYIYICVLYTVRSVNRCTVKIHVVGSMALLFKNEFSGFLHLHLNTKVHELHIHTHGVHIILYMYSTCTCGCTSKHVHTYTCISRNACSRNIHTTTPLSISLAPSLSLATYTYNNLDIVSQIITLFFPTSAVAVPLSLSLQQS